MRCGENPTKKQGDQGLAERQGDNLAKKTIRQIQRDNLVEKTMM
jgi:hypothetical protein